MKWTQLLFTSLLFLSNTAIATGIGFSQITLKDNPTQNSGQAPNINSLRP